MTANWLKIEKKDNDVKISQHGLIANFTVTITVSTFFNVTVLLLRSIVTGPSSCLETRARKE